MPALSTEPVGWGIAKGGRLPFTPALVLVVPEPSPRPTCAGLCDSACCTGEDGAEAGCWGFLAHPRLSLVPRPWIQDIEGVSAKNACSPSKTRAFVPKGKVPTKRWQKGKGQVFLAGSSSH